MLNNIILFIIASCLLFSCGFGQNKKYCSRYNTGKFRYHYRGGKDDFFFTIERNNSIQTETNQKTGDVSKLKVRWIDPCNYELRFIKGTAHLPDSLLKLKRATILRTSIIGGTNKYYLFQSKADNNDFILKDTLWIKE